MKNEKIAVIALVVIIAGALSVYLGVTYGDEIFKNLFGEKKEVKTIELGDCVDVQYIGRYASNGTVFDSSYTDVENKTGGTPLQIFVSLNKSAYPDNEDYMYYSPNPLGMIEGFVSDLVGMKNGETKNISVPVEKAYGAKLKVGDTFNTIYLAVGLNITAEVISLTNESMGLKWINYENMGNFTAPQFMFIDFTKYDEVNFTEAIKILPPCYLFENATTIINISEDSVVAKTTPTKTENLTEEITFLYLDFDYYPDGIVFPDATTATWDNDTITLTSSPEIGEIYNLIDLFGNYTYTVENVTDDKINISLLQEGNSEKIYQEYNRTMTFNRTFTLNLYYNNISQMSDIMNYFMLDIEQAGYSLYPLAGEDLVFEVTIDEIYKKS